MASDRIGHAGFAAKRRSAQDAAALIADGMTVGMSGFTGAGYPKAVPGALAGGALQINSLVSQFLTGSDEGARSVLYNADRLYQLPLGLIGVARSPPFARNQPSSVHSTGSSSA